MASQGPFYPDSVNTLSTGSESANDWLTPGNVSADDGSEAQITAATYDSPDISFRMRALVNGGVFTIPVGATIDGAIVEIDRRCFAGSAADFRVQLMQGSSLIGDNKADTGTAWPGTLTIATYGGAADGWNASLTRSIVNSQWGLALSVSATSANTDIGVDFIRFTVHYTEAGAGRVPRFSSYPQVLSH